MAKRVTGKNAGKTPAKKPSKRMSVSNVAEPLIPDPVPGDGFSISALLRIGGEKFVLTGSAFEEGITIVYREDYEDAISLGSTMDILAEIGNLIDVPNLATDVKAFIDGLPTILDEIITKFVEAEIRITTFVIDTTGSITPGFNTYEIGIGLVFQFPQPSVTNIQLDGFIVDYRTTTVRTDS